MTRIQLLLDPSTATTTTIPLAENGDSDVMIVLPDTNAFLRRVLYEQIEVRFNTRVMVKKNEANKLCVYKMEGRYTVNDYGSSELIVAMVILVVIIMMILLVMMMMVVMMMVVVTDNEYCTHIEE